MILKFYGASGFAVFSLRNPLTKPAKRQMSYKPGK